MHIGHLALNVPGVDESAEYALRSLGIVETPASAAGTRLLSADTKHHELPLIQSDACWVDDVGLEVDLVDLPPLRDRIAAAGYELLSNEQQEEGLARAFRCGGPLESRPDFSDSGAPLTNARTVR